MRVPVSEANDLNYLLCFLLLMIDLMWLINTLIAVATKWITLIGAIIISKKPLGAKNEFQFTP